MELKYESLDCQQSRGKSKKGGKFWSEENEEEEEYYCLDSNDDEEDEQQVDSEEQQEEKDNEGEIVVDEGQYPKTLLKELLDQYEDLKKASSQLPPRKASRLTSRAIGKLPNI